MGIGTEWTKPRNAVAEQITQIRLPMLLLPEAHWDFTREAMSLTDFSRS